MCWFFFTGLCRDVLNRFGLQLWPTKKARSDQCDQKKIAKSLEKLPKNDFTRKIKDFDTFTKIA